MADNSITDVVIVGGGIAGMRAAAQCIERGLSYKVIEANSYLGGRIRSESLDLSQYSQYFGEKFKYIFEHGAGWIHGVHENPLVDIFTDLFKKHEPHQRFSDQLSNMFPGNAWYMPEYTSYELFSMVDSQTQRFLTKEEYDMYLAITCIHLREIFREFNGLRLSQFCQLYIDWLEEALSNNPKFAASAGVLARAVGWYFHSLETYSGTPKGAMSASDVFVAKGTAQPFEEDVDYDILKDILTDESKQGLFDLIITASNIDMKEFTALYLQGPYAKGDAALQGCYLADHSTLKCGMSKLVDLMKKDCEALSGQEFNVDLLTKVTSIEFPEDPNDPKRAKPVYEALPEDLLPNAENKNKQHLLIEDNTNNKDENNIISKGEDFFVDNATIDGSHSTILQQQQHQQQRHQAEQNEKFNAIVHGVNVNTQEKLTYYARCAVICTASVYSLMNTIDFGPDEAKLNHVKDVLNDTSAPVFYKKVLFCFPHMWWTHKPNTRMFALTQGVTSFMKAPCKHARCQRQVAEMSPQDYWNLDVSQGGYPCIIQMAKDAVNGVTTTTTTANTSAAQEDNTIASAGLLGLQMNAEDEDEDGEEEDEDGEEEEQEQEEATTTTLAEDDFCKVNMIWESHIYNKNIPVLSASIVGNFAEQLAGMPDDIVKMIVWKQLQIVYASTVKQQHEVLGNTAFPTTIPQPLWSRVSHWAENDTILQSYSLVTDCQFSSEERVLLAQDKHIYFAGEAIHLEHGGSVHGAIFSADYAVEKINEKYVQQTANTTSIAPAEDCDNTITSAATIVEKQQQQQQEQTPE